MVGRFHRLLALAGLSLAALTALGAAPVAGAGPATPAATKRVTFDVSIGSPCILVDGPKKAVGTLAVRGPGGKLRGQVDLRLGGDGQESECIWGLSGVNGGDTVSFKTADGRTGWRVPRLSMTIDRVTDRYVVRGAPGTDITVLGIRGAAVGMYKILFGDDVLTIGPDGTVEQDPGVDLIGTDMLMTTVDEGDNSAILTMFTPFIGVTIGDPIVSGAVAPGADGVVRISRGGAVIGRGGTAEIYPGQFYARFRDAAQNPVYVRGGDRIVLDGASHLVMRVQPMTLRADPVTDTISGSCAPNAPYALTADAPFFSDRWLFVTLRGTTDATGSFRRHLRDDLRKGDELRLVCQDTKGDLTTIRRVIPR